MTQKNRTFNVIPNTVSILYFTATCCFSSVNPSLIDLECPANHVCQILCLKTKSDENYAQYCKSCYIAVFLRNCFTSFCTFWQYIMCMSQHPVHFQNHDPSESIQNMKLSMYTNFQALIQIRSLKPFFVLNSLDYIRQQQ